MKITYYGHSCFGIEIKGTHILVDPFITGNPLASKIDVNKIKARRQHCEACTAAQEVYRKCNAKRLDVWHVRQARAAL